MYRCLTPLCCMILMMLCIDGGVIIITGAVPGHCFSTRLETGSIYIVLLSRLNGDQLKALDAEIQPTQENKDEIMKACDINVQYPSGANSNNYRDHEKCPTPVPEEECIKDQNADDEFGSDSDHEQVTEDAHLSAEHTHDDHHSAEGDDHYHDHNHDGKHDHEDHHLDFIQDVAYDDTVVEDLHRATTSAAQKPTKTTKDPRGKASENNQMKTVVPIVYVTSSKSDNVDIKEDYPFTHHNLSELNYTDDVSKQISEPDSSVVEIHKSGIDKNKKERDKQETDEGDAVFKPDINEVDKENSENTEDENNDGNEQDKLQMGKEDKSEINHDKNERESAKAENDEKEDSLNKDETENSYKEVNEKDRDDESEENTDDDDELKKDHSHDSHDSHDDHHHTHSDEHHHEEGSEKDDHDHDHDHDGEHNENDQHFGHEHDDHDSDVDHSDPQHGDKKEDGENKGKDGNVSAVVGEGGSSHLQSSVLLSIILSITTLSSWLL